MKTKEYINKYKLNVNDTFNHNDFVMDLTIDFMSLLEVGKAQENIKGFENAVRAIRMKWDAVNNKTVGQLPKKLWNYFYATVIGKMKDELFPEIIAKRQREYEERKAQREFYKKENKRFEDWAFGFSWFNTLSMIFERMQIPTQSFTQLGLNSDVDKETVQKRFRKLAMSLHPDKGGDSGTFNLIVEAKNKCLAYLNNKTNKQ